MKTRAGAFTRLPPWIGVGATFVYFLYDRLELGAKRQLIAFCVALAVAGVVVRWRDASSAPDDAASDTSRRAVRAAAMLAIASIALAALFAWFSIQGTPRSNFVTALSVMLLGWSIFLLLPIARRAGAAGGIPRLGSAWRVVAGIVVAMMTVVVVGTHRVEHWTSIDELLYSMQAHLYLQGDYRWHLEPAVQRFFTLPLMATTPEGPYPQYPPGYPAILSVFVALGAPWASGALLGAVAVVSTYMLGRRCGSAFVGLVAAAMLAAHFLFLTFAALYVSHIAAMAGIATAAWLLLTPSSAGAKRRATECVLAGVFVGVSIMVRPLTGLALGLSLWLWLLSRGGWSAMRDRTLLLAVGMAIPCAALLLYDNYTNGSPFRLGYNAAQGHLNDLGFGMRGLLLYDARAQRVLAPQPFSLVEALRIEAGSVLWPLVRDVTPAFSALPLIATAYAYRVRLRWSTIAAFVVLPVAYFFYFDNGVRFYLELLPFAAVGAALIVAQVWESDARAGRALTIFLLGASVASSATSIAAAERERARHPSDYAVVTPELLAEQRTRGPLLVFVRNPPLAEPLFVGLSSFNFSPFPGPIVVARDLGAENASLICRMPGRTVMIAESARDGHGARLLPTHPDSARGSQCRARAFLSLTRIRE